MNADHTTGPLDLAAIRARAEWVAARRHHWAREAGVADPDVVADLRRAKELAVDDVPALLAKVERLRRLVGDEDQPGWEGCSRAEAIRQAESFHASVMEWKREHDACRDERAETRAEVEQLRRERDTMLRIIGDLVDSDDCWFDHHGGCQAHGYLSLEPGEKCPQQEAKELIAAVDALDTAATAPAAAGEAAR